MNCTYKFAQKQYLVGLVLSLFFILSIIVRLPNLNRPLSKHHEWLTAHCLRHQQIWYEKGGLKQKFLPLMSYSKKADKNIRNHSSNHKDSMGNFYYTSYPPFTYIFPYLIFRLFNIYPNVLPLQIFNLAFHFVCCFFIYLIIALLTKEYYVNCLNIPALVGFVVYLFSTHTLWFHSNIYFAEIFIQPFFIIGTYVYLKIIVSEYEKPIYYTLLGVINFLMVYTEWLGLFFAFTASLYALFNIKKKKMRIILFILTFTSITPLALTIWHYSQISGFGAFFKSSFDKYLIHSGFAQRVESPFHYWELKSWITIASHYIIGYLPFLIAMFMIIIAYTVLFKKRFAVRKNKIEIIALYLCITPALLHHLVFFNFTASHDFSALKTGVFIAITISLFYHKLIHILRSDSLDENRVLKTKLLNGIIILAVILSMRQYGYINSFGHDYYKKVGETIRRTAKNDEVVFVRPESLEIWPDPQMVFYAHRNIAIWENDSAAKKLLKENNVERGVIFILNRGNDKIIIDKEYIKK